VTPQERTAIAVPPG